MSIDTAHVPVTKLEDESIIGTLEYLVELREYFTIAIIAHTEEFIPFLETVHDYADWLFDAYKERVLKHPSPFDNAFAMLCDAGSSGEWSALTTWLWLRCNAFPTYKLSSALQFSHSSWLSLALPYSLPTSASHFLQWCLTSASRNSASKWLRWFLSDRSSRQLRDKVLPNLYSTISQQLLNLPHLIRTSTIPSWSNTSTTNTDTLRFEVLAIYKIKNLPSLPDVATSPQLPDVATLKRIQA